jgi:glucosamine--fructose-6-phosphate aminotransferase (isomerizing)
VTLLFSGTVGSFTEAAEESRKYGAFVVAVTDDLASPLAQASDETLLLGDTAASRSAGTSGYLVMLATLLTLAGHLADLCGDHGRLRSELARLPEQVAATLDGAADTAAEVAQTIQSAPETALLGAGPNEATARFGGLLLSSVGERSAVATDLDEWDRYKEHLVNRPGTRVVLVNPTGAARDRGAEVLRELGSLSAVPVLVSDRPTLGPTGGWILPIAPGVSEELSPVTACLPLALLSSELIRLDGERSAATHGIS